MIQSKKELKNYLEQDRLALHYTKKRPGIIKDEIWKFEILLRKNEYCTNCLHKIWHLPYKAVVKFLYHRLAVRLGFSIPLNCFGPGLSIAHYGLLTVGNAQVGKNCRIQEGVNIGATGGSNLAAAIGDNVFIGTGAKIIGNIKIADDVAIGAGAVVTKDILEAGITVAGVPAKKISNNNSHAFIDPRVL